MKIDKKDFLSSVFVVMLILSNILSGRILALGKFAVSGGIICYAICCLLFDVISELYGRQQSKKVLLNGFLCQIISVVVINLTLLLPPLNTEDNMFKLVFSNNIWFVIGSLTAYLISHSIDIKVFYKLKSMLIKNNKPYKFVWCKVSTVISQAVDTIVFTFIGYGLGLGFIWQLDTRLIMFQIMTTQYLIKLILTAIDTPFFYVLTRRSK